VRRFKTEKDVMHDVIWMLRHVYGFWPDHCEDGPGKKRPGRPDIIVMSTIGPGYYIEVKDFDMRKTSFAFSEIGPEQRKWLTIWNDARDSSGSFIAFGTTNCPNDQRLYIVPWNSWLLTEDIIAPQKSITFDSTRATNTRYVIDRGYDLRMLEPYKCPRVETKNRLDAGWRLPREDMLKWK
jgi:hypothetical protein